MPNLLITIAYDGSHYHGWQIQKNALAVQEVFQKSLFRIIQEKADLKGCSRTDSGVHAKEYCLSLKTEHDIPCNQLLQGLNHYLPSDIAVKVCQKVPDAFHARYSCIGKEYIYKIWNAPIRNPFLNTYAFHYWPSIDLDLLNQAASYFVGSHNFCSFCTSDLRKQMNLVRTIQKATLNKKGEMIEFTIIADGFLYNMVRIIVGTLLRVAERKIKAEDIPFILSQKNRSYAGPTAPPHGLYLNRVFY